ncbi:hypothetical protein B0H21DRAFT_725561 [Amylocystis lapponica]|nr:hypothetical protein B0H21DRAFT_725561 [Amylocystis lapponica]
MASLSDSETLKELTVTFQPPLFLQRRGWVFDILRRENVRTVLDVGCGEGELIACLCNPAPWLLPPPLKRNGSDPLVLPACDPTEGFMHPVRVLALDISSEDLQSAVACTAPRCTSTSSASHIVKIWEGGLQCINSEFVGVECIVSTEVLQDFAPVLLGVYHPRLLLITTPSYTFNARFTPPDAPAGVRSGYIDPTGRTARIFRHDDHKFEWTVEEFTQWCVCVAEQWGYDVEIGGVGKAEETDEWGRDEELGWASQVAAFTRREGKDYSVARRRRTQHRLLATHLHTAHEQAQQPGSLQAIGDLVKARMLHYRESTISVSEVWFEHDVGVLCGGWIELLLHAIAEHKDLQLDMSTASVPEKWEVHLTGSLVTERDLWLARKQDDVDHILTGEQSSTTLDKREEVPWSPNDTDDWGAPDVSDRPWGSTQDWDTPATSLIVSAPSGWA